MKRSCPLLAWSLGALLFGLASMAQAQAPATRTWVSLSGDNTNPCSQTAPCRTFAGALSKTAAGGEISVLDPGGYGPVTLTKSITLNGDGTLAGITVTSGDGIIIDAGSNDTVRIRNLSINGVGSGLNGIRYLNGREVVLEDCSISGFTSRGIDVSLSEAGHLYVHDTTITTGATGIRVETTSGSATLTMDNVRIEGMATGVELAGAAGTLPGVIRRSTLNSNGTAVLLSGAGVRLSLEDTVLAFNATALNLTSAATARLADNGIYNNGNGILFVQGATVMSAGDNRVRGNTASQAPNYVMSLE